MLTPRQAWMSSKGERGICSERCAAPLDEEVNASFSYIFQNRMGSPLPPGYRYHDPDACPDSPELCMEQALNASRPGDAPMPSPGIEKLRWLKPVRPGDTLRQTRRVDRVNPSGSRPDRGLVWHNHDLFNQRGECVMSMTSMVIVGRRPMAEGA